MQKKLTAQGLRFLEEGQFSKARDLLSLLITQFPSDAEAHHLLGIIELERSNLDTAYIFVNTAVDIDSTNSIFYTTLGNIEFQRHNFSAAEKAFINALRYNPEKIEYSYNLAKFYLSQQQYAKAIDSYYNILRLDPSNYLAIRGITISYLFFGETTIAIEHANEWVAEYPDHDEAYYYQGLCFYALHDLNQALAAYDKGLNFGPNNAAIMAGVAACYLALGNSNIAESYLHKALTLEPHNPIYIYNLACLEFDRNNIITAEDLFANAFNLDKNYYETLCGLGKIELFKHNTECALNYFSQARKLEPTSNIPKLLSATTKLQAGDFAAGWQEYANVFTIHAALQAIQEWKNQELSTSETLLVWTPKEHFTLAQQIMFYGMLAEMQQRVKKFIFLCDESLVDLMQNFLPSCTVVSELKIKNITHHISLPALGKYCQINNKAYLTVNHQQAKNYQQKYKKLYPGKKLIGLSLKSIGNNKFTDYAKSIHPHQLEKLFALTGCEFIHIEEDINAAAAQLPDMDLIISVDNYIAHLAGAMGLRVYTLLTLHTEWYWLNQYNTAVWYPNMQLLRQTHENSLMDIVNQLTEIIKTV